jgi:hypothetical protein
MLTNRQKQITLGRCGAGSVSTNGWTSVTTQGGDATTRIVAGFMHVWSAEARVEMEIGRIYALRRKIAFATVLIRRGMNRKTLYFDARSSSAL